MPFFFGYVHVWYAKGRRGHTIPCTKTLNYTAHAVKGSMVIMM